MCTTSVALVGFIQKKKKQIYKLTVGCSATTAETKTEIRVITMKNVLSPQSCPDGVNQWKRRPEKTKVAT